MFWTVQVKVPALPGLRLVGTPLLDIDTETWGAFAGGGVPGGDVVRCSSLNVVDEPATSFAVTREVSVICAFCICTATSITTTCPGAIVPSPQATFVTPVPLAVQVPCGGSATMMNAPSVVLRTLFTITFVTGKSEVFVTVTSYETIAGTGFCEGGPETRIFITGTLAAEGVIGTEGADSRPFPPALVAWTLKLYAVPSVRPETMVLTLLVAGAATVELIPEGTPFTRAVTV